MPASSHSLDRIDVTFDDDRAVAHAGLVLTGTLLQKLKLETVTDEMVDVSYRPGRKMAALVWWPPAVTASTMSRCCGPVQRRRC